ncbi:NACHT domain-containing protein [Streptomyces sp. NPDC001422]|uniref:NACHT domain-containing protein n=1 Tax=Streptomyces sp. NPDC001422 TaxID=3364575 RepID=UPI00369F2050
MRALRTEAETACRKQNGAGGLQPRLERAVRKTGLPGTASFEGKVASRWAPQEPENFSVPRAGSAEQVLAVVAVWESWTGASTLDADGHVRRAWFARGAKDWTRLLEAAQHEAAGLRKQTAASSSREADVDAAIARYFERLVATCGRLNLDVLGPGERAGEQPMIRLRQVFEPPPASWDPPRPELPARLWHKLVENGEVPAEELPPGLRAEQVAAWRTARAERPPVPVLEAVASPEGHRLVLLGDPGAGKSTLSRYLALALAGGLELEKLPVELQELTQAGAVPVVVELRHLADGERWRGRTVEDFWEEFNTTERMSLPRDVLEYLLERTHRPVLVIFDGLDEIFDPARRAEVARQVAAFAEVHEHVRVILTSRVIGFTREVFTAAGFSQAKLEDLPKQQIDSFIRRWYTAAHPDDPNEAARLSERLISAVRGYASVAELAGNPLLLTILASIGLGAAIPRDRREVYRHAVDVLTGRWDRDAKHLSLPPQNHPDVAAAIDELDRELLQELLERLARRLQESAGSDQGSPLISRTELTEMIANYVVADMNYPAHVGRIVANSMVDRLHERAFLLHPYGAGMYGFVHRTFLEYLAARELNRRYTGREWTPEQLIDMLAERATNPVWHEVILLFIGQISRQAEAEHATFIARLLHMHRHRGVAAYRQTDERKHGYRFLELAIRVLAEAHRIPRAPSLTGDHPERSLAIQSNAVIDTLTAHLSNHPWDALDGALPALMSFPWSWTGRERYQRWYRTDPSDAGPKDLLAAAFCRTPQEATRLAQMPWSEWAAQLAFQVLEDRWSDRDDVYDRVLNIARDPGATTHAQRAALQMLGERWSDREDAYNTVLNIARDPDTRAYPCAAALEVLGEFWSDREDAYTVILNIARNPGSDSLDVAVNALGQKWPDRDDAYNAVLDVARNPRADVAGRGAALRALGECWPDREETYSTILHTARNPDTYTSVDVAVRMLGKRWPDRNDAYNTVLEAAREPNTEEYTQYAAVTVLGEFWSDRDDAYNAVLDIARTASNESTGYAAVRALEIWWSDRNDTYNAVLGIARNPDIGDYAPNVAVKALGGRWPDHDDLYKDVLDTARNLDTSPRARTAAFEVLVDRWSDRDGVYNAVLDGAHGDVDSRARAGALLVLGDQWPDREDTYTAFLDAARNPTVDYARAGVLRELGEQWPDREDTYATVLDAARNPDTDDEIRATALQVLGEQWPDRDDTHTTVLDTARNPDTDDYTRATALQVLGEQWPDRDDTHTTVLDTARNPDIDSHTRATALQVLAQRWPEEADTWNYAARCIEEMNSPAHLSYGIVELVTRVWPEKPATEKLLVKLAEVESFDTIAREALFYIAQVKKDPK